MANKNIASLMSKTELFKLYIYFIYSVKSGKTIKNK